MVMTRFLLPREAVIFAVPFFTAVTLPILSTFATDALVDFHLAIKPVALAGLGLAVSCKGLPCASRMVPFLFRAMLLSEVFDCTTRTVHLNTLPPSFVLTVMVALPGLRPFTLPVLLLTVAIFLLADVQLTVLLLAFAGYTTHGSAAVLPGVIV